MHKPGDRLLLFSGWACTYLRSSRASPLLGQYQSMVTEVNVKKHAQG